MSYCAAGPIPMLKASVLEKLDGCFTTGKQRSRCGYAGKVNRKVLHFAYPFEANVDVRC